ncbi:MAG: hypothetical protein AAB589_02840, partial [Patescibacteria group bacterium]
MKLNPQTKNYLVRGLILSLLTANLLSPLSASAQFAGLPNSGGLRTRASVLGQTTPTPNIGELDTKNLLRPPQKAGDSSSAQEILGAWREEDQKQCEIEVKGKKPATYGQAVAETAFKKPIKNLINEAVGMEVMPKTVNAVTTSAAPAIEGHLRQGIQTGMTERLKEEVPKTLAEKLQAFREQGVTEEMLRDRGQFRQLVTDSVRESWPRVLNEEFIKKKVSESVNHGLRDNLQENLKLNFHEIAKPTIETYYRAEINTVLLEIPQMAVDQVETLVATFRATIDGIKASIQNVGLSFSSANIPFVPDFLNQIIGTVLGLASLPETGEEILGMIENLKAQAEETIEFFKWAAYLTTNREAITDELVNGFAFQLEQSMTDPKNISKLADAIANAIEKPINNSLENSIDKAMDHLVGPLGAVEKAINTMDEQFLNPIVNAVDLQLNVAIAAITTPTTIIIDHVGDSIAKSIDDTVGATLYPFAAGVTNNAFAAGNFIADGINKVGFSLHDAVFPPPRVEVVADDTYGPLLPNQVKVSEANDIRIIPNDAIRGPGEIHYDAYVNNIDPNTPTPALDESAFFAETTGQEVTAAAPAVTENVITNNVAKNGAAAGLTNFSSNLAKGLAGSAVGVIGGLAGSMFEGNPMAQAIVT